MSPAAKHPRVLHRGCSPSTDYNTNVARVHHLQQVQQPTACSRHTGLFVCPWPTISAHALAVPRIDGQQRAQALARFGSPAAVSPSSS